MAVYGIKKKVMSISVTAIAYRSIAELARQQGMTANQYVRALMIAHLQKMRMPIYYEESGEQ